MLGQAGVRCAPRWTGPVWGPQVEGSLPNAGREVLLLLGLVGRLPGGPRRAQPRLMLGMWRACDSQSQGWALKDYANQQSQCSGQVTGRPGKEYQVISALADRLRGWAEAFTAELFLAVTY